MLSWVEQEKSLITQGSSLKCYGAAEKISPVLHFNVVYICCCFVNIELIRIYLKIECRWTMG